MVHSLYVIRWWIGSQCKSCACSVSVKPRPHVWCRVVPWFDMSKEVKTCSVSLTCRDTTRFGNVVWTVCRVFGDTSNVYGYSLVRWDDLSTVCILVSDEWSNEQLVIGLVSRAHSTKLKKVKVKGKGLDTCYSAAYMSQTRDQQRFVVQR